MLLFRGALFQKADRPAPRYLLPGKVQSAALGDLDGDGRPDVVTALASGEIAVLRNVFAGQDF